MKWRKGWKKEKVQLETRSFKWGEWFSNFISRFVGSTWNRVMYLRKCSNHSRGHFGFYRIELKYFGFCISKETTLKDWFFRIIREWFECLFKYFSWNLFSLQMLNEPIFCSLRWRKTKLVIMNHLEKVLGIFFL